MRRVPDPLPSGVSDLPPAGWSGRERLVLVVLLVALGALVFLRASTRRADSARPPLDLDVLVIHAAGLRADAAPTESLANDLDFDPADMLLWINAFAQGTEAERSARAFLEGDLVRDLSAGAAPLSLQRRLAERGWRTILVDDGDALGSRLQDGFGTSVPIETAEAAPGALAAHWPQGDEAPAFAFVQLGFGEEPLHSDTPEAYVLQERYRLRLRRIREVVRAVARAARSDRPQLVVLMGANGLALGEHPSTTELPYDELVQVPLLLGLRNADGLPTGTYGALVQSADLGPTLLDILDLRSREERKEDGIRRVGRSLEPHIHGWRTGPVHQHIVLFGVEHLAVRSADWKLIAPFDPPLRPRRPGSILYSLQEDPGERNDLLRNGEPGPVSDTLFEILGDRFGAPQAAR